MGNNNQMPNSNSITILHQNICGLKKKTNELIGSMFPDLPHVLCITEHHLQKSELEQISINNYRLGAAYCRQAVKRGGVCIFVHETLRSTNIDLVAYCKEQVIEACALKIETTLFNAIIIAIYRTPNGNFNLFLSSLDNIIRSLFKVGVKLIICGDINVNYLTDSDKKRKLDVILLTYNLTGIVQFPTRTHSQSSTAIDNIFLDTCNITNYTISPLYNGLSDHDAQLLTLNDVNTKLQICHFNIIRNINIFSIEEFKTRLSYESWDSIFSSNRNMDIDSLFNLFLNNYLRIFYTSFPYHKVAKNSSNNSWITTGIRTSCRRKRCLYLLTRDSKDTSLKNHYKQYCKILTSVINEAKKYTYDNRIAKSTNKMKTTWNIIKTETNRLKGTSTSTPRDHLLSPETFNKYFLSVSENIIQEIRCDDKLNHNSSKKPNDYLSNLLNKPIPSIRFKNTSTKEIERIINSLKTKESSGYDEISTKILKKSAPFISSPLSYIFNKSMLAGTFPNRLKYAIVKPLFKKGDRENVANYRPISLLTLFSKVFEKIIYKRILKHVETNNILVDEQYGFRTSSSTDKASYKLIDNILNALNNKIMVGGIFCDLQKAFDCVNHNILLTKLEFYGITGITLKLIKSYLNNRYQKVVLNNHLYNSSSNCGKITHGVPQGSILGPLLFLLYINDLPRITNDNTKIILFADDTSIIITNPNLINFERNVNKTIKDINEWFHTNLLALNLDKTHFIQFMTKNSSLIDFSITHGKKKIANTRSTKFLGLSIEKTLSWRTHIDTIVPKLSSACFAMRAIKPFLSQDSMRMVYYSYFHSIMTYGLIFWGNSHHSSTIFRLQKRIIRTMVGIRSRDSCRDHFKRLKILPLKSQYLLSLMLFVVDNGDQFKANITIHNFNTRTKLNLHRPISNLSVHQNGTYYSGIRVFNSLPTQIKVESHNRNHFKRALKSFLYTHSFYTLDEYFNCTKN